MLLTGHTVTPDYISWLWYANAGGFSDRSGPTLAVGNDDATMNT